MSIKDLKPDAQKKSGTGTLKATISNDYPHAREYNGEPFVFVTDNKKVALFTTDEFPDDPLTKFNLSLDLPADKPIAKYEFRSGSLPTPPSFSRVQGSSHTVYGSDENFGYLNVIDLDLSKGTLKADFIFAYTDYENDGKRHEVTGVIDVAGLEVITSK
ncbi:hypothetical protein ACKJSM_19170 [Pseudomonas sp. PHC1]|uniref:hypothetical protein n=1 Tax=Pseudomonas sp. PHC1 TaxID=3384759 RepID=UPI00396F7332